jgi:hypothetical protein
VSVSGESDTTLTPPQRGRRPEGMYGALHGEDDERGELVPDGSFLSGVDARRGRWRDAALEARGVSSQYFWTGRGRDALEVAYGTAAAKPNATTVREVGRQRHGRAAAPLLVVVAYPRDRPPRAAVCGPGGEDPPSSTLSATTTSAWPSPRSPNPTATSLSGFSPPRWRGTRASSRACATRTSWPPTSSSIASPSGRTGRRTRRAPDRSWACAARDLAHETYDVAGAAEESRKAGP